MSPLHKGSAYIACHVYNKKDSSAYFAALKSFKLWEDLCWGKMNTFTREVLQNVS